MWLLPLVCVASASPIVVTVNSPPQMVADGITPIPLELRVSGAGALSPVVSATPDKGKILATGPLFMGKAQLAYLPPRSTVPTRVELKIRVTADGRSVTERLSLNLKPLLTGGARAAATFAQGSADAPITLQLATDWALLSKDVRPIEIALDVPDPDAKNISLSTSAGTVSVPQPIEGNPTRFLSTFTPAAIFSPHAAIIVASVDLNGKRHFTWKVIQLWGAGAVTVRARPGTMVKVNAGTRDFGPVQADESGNALVRLEVPPGVDTVYAGGRPLTLPSVPFLRAFAVPGAGSVAGDGTSAAPLMVFAVGNKGEPLTTPGAIRLETDGSLTPLRMIAPGEFSADFTPPARGTGEPVVRASVVDGPGHVSEARFRLTGGKPARIEVGLSPPRLVAGANEANTLSVRLLDAAGLPAGGKLDVTTTGGVVGPLDTTEVGLWTAEIRAAIPLPTSRKTRIKARVLADDGSTALEREVEFPTDPADPVRVLVSAPAHAQADGRERAVDIVVEDVYGNGVGGLSLLPKADTGRLSTPEDLGLGRYHLRYEAPFSYEPTRDTLRIDAGDVAGVAALDLRAMPKRVSVGVVVGLMTNVGTLQAGAIQVDAGWRFAGLDNDLLAGLSVVAELGAFHRFTSAKVEGYTVETQFTGVPLGTGLRYGVELLPGFEAEAQATVAAGLFNNVVLINGSVASVERVLGPGGAAQLGIAWHVGPGALVLQARGMGFAARQQSFDGAIWGLALQGGYRFEIL